MRVLCVQGFGVPTGCCLPGEGGGMVFACVCIGVGEDFACFWWGGGKV